MTDAATHPTAGSTWSRIVGPFGKSISGTVGAILVLIVLVFVFIGPLVWTVDPNAQNLIDSFLAFSSAHPLGTDDQGRDTLARMMVGGRTSLLIGFGSMSLGLVLGATAGIVAALRGGIAETLVMRFVDALLALPGIVQAVIFAAIFGRGLGPLIIALGIYSLPIFARVSYTMTRQVIGHDYFNAAIILGASKTRAVFIHILPNIATAIMAVATLRIGSNILTGAALNFFGLGVQPPSPEWGLMIADARQFSWQTPELLILPGIALFITSIGFNLLGDGIRDWFDPKLRNT
ncbi:MULTISPECIES: ABC transporter permease [Chelativorans]|jgi:ABC-type dipeptide/oligopeptide/nickel transport system permease subunit|uniref:Binding-protein-dependent transport systems inner membrane component n=1 Tax=Chelativorans sp. (strain BNC1) TaxID=266779 RepID=Q11EZ8_CHESB|nr:MULTISPECIES: ABC transporter permease [Chelativorans]